MSSKKEISIINTFANETEDPAIIETGKAENNTKK